MLRSRIVTPSSPCCGSPHSARLFRGARVRGTVSFNGEPVSDGTITFVASVATPKGPERPRTFRVGKYSLRGKQGFQAGLLPCRDHLEQKTGRR